MSAKRSRGGDGGGGGAALRNKPPKLLDLAPGLARGAALPVGEKKPLPASKQSTRSTTRADALIRSNTPRIRDDDPDGSWKGMGVRPGGGLFYLYKSPGITDRP